MKFVNGLGVVVTASIALLQPVQGRSAGGGHSFGGGHFSGYHSSGSGGRYGHYYGGPRYYGGGARYYSGGARYYSGGARYYSGGARYYSGGARYYRSAPRLSSQAMSRSSAYYSRGVNRTTALNPRGNSRLTANRAAALRSQGFDSQGRVPASASHGWNQSHDHFWHGHQCHWHNNAWVIIDPWPWYGDWYGYGYGYYPYDPYAYDPGYYDDSYAPGDAQYDNRYQDSAVSDVQSALAQKGYYHGAIDGQMGAETRSAVRQYQRNHGLEVTGNIDQSVVDSLRHR